MQQGRGSVEWPLPLVRLNGYLHYGLNFDQIQIGKLEKRYRPMTREESNNDGRPRTLSRTQLTLALILVTLLPFCTVVAMYSTLPSIEDPVLEVKVDIGPRAWPNDSDPNARIVPCVILRNPTSDTWNYLNMSINDQFHFTHPDLVKPSEEVFVPLKFFHTKGNAYFPPESQDLQLLTIYAQVPSGARAIRELHAEELQFKRPNVSN